MKVIAVTGSICTGKSFVCDILSKLGFDIFYCDAEVHKILKKKNIIKRVRHRFREALIGNSISRAKLADIIFHDETKRDELENIIYPELFKRQRSFEQAMRKKKAEFVFVEVPLLYEKSSEGLYDLVIVTHAPKKIMMERAVKRKLDLKRFNEILKTQLKSSIKKAKADYLVDTNKPKAKLREDLKNIIIKIKSDGKRNYSGP